MLNFFRNLFRRFYPIETIIIDAVKAKLSPPAQEILEAQLKAIRKVARSPGHTELMMWFNKGIKPFPNATLVLNLATCKIKVPDSRRHLKAEVHLVRGHIFSVQFKSSIKKFRNQEDLAVTTVELHADPMCHVETVEPEPIDPNLIKAIELEEPFKDWNSKYTTIESVKPPKTTDAIQQALNVFPALFPLDYIELLKQTDGAFIDNLIVFGTDEIVGVDYEGNKYFAIGTIDGDYIAVLPNAAEVKLFRLIHDDTKPVALGSSLKTAIEISLK